MFNVDGFPSNCLNKCWMLIWVHRHINIFCPQQHIDICSTYRHFGRSYQFLRANSQNVPPQKVCHNLTASGSETALIQSPFHTTGSIESTAVWAGTSVWFQPLTKPPCVKCDRPVPATAWTSLTVDQHLLNICWSASDQHFTTHIKLSKCWTNV